MSLQQWADNGWLRPHKTSAGEIENLIKIVDRDLSDATEGISSDWRFGIAYNAALKLCTILLYASGYRAERSLQHYRTIQAMPLVLGGEREKTMLSIWRHAGRRGISWNRTMWEPLQRTRQMNSSVSSKAYGMMC
jgi:hypothetical protein